MHAESGEPTPEQARERFADLIREAEKGQLTPGGFEECEQLLPHVPPEDRR